MNKHREKSILAARTSALAAFACLAISGFFLFRGAPKTIGSEIKAPTPVKAKSAPKPAAKPPAKFSEFPHDKHKNACNSCHKFPSANWKKVRPADSAFPDITEYPKHESCLNCHRKQFFGGPKPVICSICHTNPGPRNSSRHPFPNPREIFDQSPKGKKAVSDFAVSFKHEIHIGIVAQNGAPVVPKRGAGAFFVNARWTREGEESCSVCHQTYNPQGESDDEYFTKPPEDVGDRFWLKKGTFKTAPIGHTVCSTCHSDDAGILPAPSDCAACHKLKPKETPTDFDEKIAAAMKLDDRIMLTAWRRRASSGAFRHEWTSHADLECATCHNVSEINTLEAATKKVPILSCAVCHITATADDGGILNFEVDSKKADPGFQCVKCHISYGKLAVPESHLKAIAAQ